jgi:hypothetical protein
MNASVEKVSVFNKLAGKILVFRKQNEPIPTIAPELEEATTSFHILEDNSTSITEVEVLVDTSVTVLPSVNKPPRESVITTKVWINSEIELTKEEAINLANHLVFLGFKKPIVDREIALQREESIMPIFEAEYKIKGKIFTTDELITIVNDLMAAGYTR